ncbi:uncharacterized protein LOC134209075 [Armigeres subalbatus]|uniref:uncharacterized protein LOC134209075 n=1 Tax=Armigeres subalbatus TaxID=124917 RepID=UPI002ED5AA37
MALRQYHCLEKRLSKDPELAQVLEQKITDYINKGYIRKLSQKEIDQHSARTWYLPIFAVTNINKPGKVRLVWDAAATAFGKSLNSALLKGPDQTCSLFAILLRFREGRIGLTGDIREMFHQVLIREADQTSQRFFWKESTGEIGVYAMRVMTFGACCSPSSAQFVKNMNAERFRERSPAAYEAITKSHYVDDMLISVDSEEEAIQLANEVKNINAAGGFEIRNWISNSTLVLATLNESTTEEKCLDLASEMLTEKVLGMWWNTASDVFTYKMAAGSKGLISSGKRKIYGRNNCSTVFRPSCSTVNELRPSFVAVHQTLEPVICVENYSSWCKLVRIVAYVQRFLKKFQLKHLTKSPIIKECLSSDELRMAENYLLSQA